MQQLLSANHKLNVLHTGAEALLVQIIYYLLHNSERASCGQSRKSDTQSLLNQGKLPILVISNDHSRKRVAVCQLFAAMERKCRSPRRKEKQSVIHNALID